jgi:quercetin dioxygenase-like cupin family protein
MSAKMLLKGKPFLISNKIEWEQLGNGVKRKILGYDEKVMMVIVHFEKGAVGNLHHHGHRQIAYVASGKFSVTINGQGKTLEQGDSFFVAPNLMHDVVALEGGSLVDVFAPARDYFL